MKLKTLLLGSAAALMAVTGARAADAVIAEPEPVEYVRVCDMYGAGFYYIPGTETCLRFDGYVRVDFTKNTDVPVAGTPASFRLDDATGLIVPVPAVAGRTTDNSRWDYRVRVNIDARNETDWGTLRSQVRLQADGDGGPDAAVGIDRALISLSADGGEVRLGYSDAWNTTFHGYGTYNEKYDGGTFYAYDQAIFFDYTYAANGFTATAGIQSSVGNDADNDHVNMDYYAGVGYTGSWGGARISYLHEDVTDEGYIKASVDLNLIENLAIRGVLLWDGEDGADSTAAVAAGDYHYLVGARYTFSPEWSADINYHGSDDDSVVQDEITVGVRWNPVPGLSIRPTAAFRDDTNSYSLRVYRTW
ncbi:porin [Pseudahrensia aquimaris]|uniref:Porin n=1 Tax=Pseudahrensia aquimaris TaxID=744461 RepID=A0ABW3FBF4_9HYPH